MKLLARLLCFGDAKGHASGEADASMASDLLQTILEPFYGQIQDVAEHIEKLSFLLSNIKLTNEESKAVTTASSIKAANEKQMETCEKSGKNGSKHKSET